MQDNFAEYLSFNRVAKLGLVTFQELDAALPLFIEMFENSSGLLLDHK